MPFKSSDKQSVPAYQVQKHDIISSKSARYLVGDFNGEGCYGKVAKCINLKTLETTAIKFHKESEYYVIQKEVEMLQKLGALDPEKKNLVKFNDSFMFQGVSCLAFEMLDRSLEDLVEQRQARLSLNEIRPIIHQLLVAFEALKGIGIIHADLKPDNIMLVNHQDQPFRVKLIDFGLALPACKAKAGMTLQAALYRAPEVILGLPISEAIDMWGLGCVMVYLYFGIDLFLVGSMYQLMKGICQLLGRPEDQLLSAGKNTWQYFTWEEESAFPGWRLKTQREHKKATGEEPTMSWWAFDTFENLLEAVQSLPETEDDHENADRMAFADLLEQMLHVDAKARITPGQALKHDFITMAHLEALGPSPYAEAASELMMVSTLDDSDESLSDSEADIESTDPSDGVTDPTACCCDPPAPISSTHIQKEPLENLNVDEPGNETSCNENHVDQQAFFNDPSTHRTFNDKPVTEGFCNEYNMDPQAYYSAPPTHRTFHCEEVVTEGFCYEYYEDPQAYYSAPATYRTFNDKPVTEGFCNEYDMDPQAYYYAPATHRTFNDNPVTEGFCYEYYEEPQAYYYAPAIYRTFNDKPVTEGFCNEYDMDPQAYYYAPATHRTFNDNPVTEGFCFEYYEDPQAYYYAPPTHRTFHCEEAVTGDFCYEYYQDPQAYYYAPPTHRTFHCEEAVTGDFCYEYYQDPQANYYAPPTHRTFHCEEPVTGDFCYEFYQDPQTYCYDPPAAVQW